MRNMKKTTVMMLLGAAMLLAGCGSKKAAVQTAAYREHPTECLGKSMDGQQTLKVWAKGTSRMEAVREAKKKVVGEVLFQGIQSTGECSAYPIVDTPNARQKFESYFNKFFADGGAFKKYVDEVEKRSDADLLQGAHLQTYGVVLKVDTQGLRKRMQKDKIIGN